MSLVASFPLDAFCLGQRRRQQPHTSVVRSEKCRRLRGTIWHTRQVIIGGFLARGLLLHCPCMERLAPPPSKREITVQISQPIRGEIFPCQGLFAVRQAALDMTCTAWGRRPTDVQVLTLPRELVRSRKEHT